MQDIKINKPNSFMISIDTNDTHYFRIMDKDNNILGNITEGDLKQQLEKYGYGLTIVDKYEDYSKKIKREENI